MDKLSNLNEQLATKIAAFDKENLNISKANVGWHVNHSYLVINSIIKALINSNEAAYAPKFNFPKTLVLILGKIPRGKAKAPRQVTPLIENDVDAMKTFYNKTSLNISLLNTITAKQHFSHPYFGQLNKKETLRFLEIHTKHHLKIIDAILAGS